MQVFDILGNSQLGEVRTVTINDEPWFVAADVCAYFGVTNRNRVMQQLDADEKGGTQIHTPGGMQTVTIINEPGLYSLLFALEPKMARGVSPEYIEKRWIQLRAFKRWVTHEVLPSLHRHGVYATDALLDRVFEDPEWAIEHLKKYKRSCEQRCALTEAADGTVAAK